MKHRLIAYTVAFFSCIFLLSFIVFVNPVFAASCSGSGPSCCTSYMDCLEPPGCDPSGCDADDPYCVECTSNLCTCFWPHNPSCSLSGNSCSWSCNGSSGSSGCSYTPTPSGVPTPTPLPPCNIATSWSAWSGCTAPCNGGTTTRSNTCSGLRETVACNTNICPLTPCTDNPDAYWTGWDGSADCGTYTQTRRNTCTGATESRPVDTGISCCNWNSWSSCDNDCGTGQQSRTDDCGHRQYQGCSDYSGCPTCDPSLPINQTGWLQCSSVCNGVQEKYACGRLYDTRACNVNAPACPQNTTIGTNSTATSCSRFDVLRFGTTVEVQVEAEGSSTEYMLPNPSFEDGTFTWFAWPNELLASSIFNCNTNPSLCGSGLYSFGIQRTPTATDPYITSQWFDPGLGDLSGKSFVLKFMARGEGSASTISRIALQSRPVNDDWGNDSAAFAQIPNITVQPGVWQTYEYPITFNTPGYGSTTSQMRIVLRTPWNGLNGFYDAIELKNITLIDWVKLYYTPYQAGPTANYCGVTWTELSPVTYVGPPIFLGTPYYSANIDTTNLAHGSKYYVVANIQDSNGNACTANPSGACGTAFETCGAGCRQVYTVCKPNCTPYACNQLDGCGTTCTNADGNPPAIPTIVSPTTNQQVTPAVGGTYTISWSSADATTDSYEYIIYPTVYTSPDTALAAATAGAPEVFYGSLVASNGTFNSTITADSVSGANLRLAIRAYNTTCTTALGNAPGISPWRSVDFTLIGTVIGEYMDDSVGGVCTSTTNVVLPNTGNIVQIRRNGNPVAQAITSGSVYTLTTLYNPTTAWNTINGGALTAQLEIHNTDLTQAYICSSCSGLVQTGSCNANSSLCTCTRSGTITTATSFLGPRMNFYLRKYNLANDPWWQTWGGLVLARGMMSSNGPIANIPESCVPNTQCDPAIVQTSNGPAGNPSPTFNETAGIPIVGGANGMSGGNGVGGYYSNNPNNTRVTATTTTNGHSEASVKVENYTYFANTTALSVPANSDGSTTQIAQLSELTATALSTGTGEVGYTVPGNLTINLDKDTKWSVPAGTKAVVFVPGDLTLVAADADPNTAAQMQQLINVDEGGFLAFIVKNDIIIESSLGYNGTKTTIAGLQTPIIEGIFLASRNLIIKSFDSASTTPADNKFVGAGSFIGLSGVDLQREYSDTTTRRELNATAPTETFIFRPDFVVNTPNVLKKPVIQWKEINS